MLSFYRRPVAGHLTATVLVAMLSATAAMLMPVLAAAPAAAQGAMAPHEEALLGLVNGRQRTEPNRVRDAFRRPFDVLQFLEIKPTSTVVEISPGAVGYWTEILAPYLRDKGLYIAANPAPRSQASKANVDKFNAAFADKMASDGVSFAKVQVLEWAPETPENLQPNSADFVLTFRNLHNWIDRDVTDKALASFHRVLKAGGVLGIKDHRGRTDQPQDPKAKSGYVRQDYAIQMIEKAGFRLVATSEAVANPKDTKDYAAGVWALPPTYRMKDQDRDKLTAIGESDRFLLAFVKR